MNTIREIGNDEDLQPYVEIIRVAFQTVADDFNLTKNNNPSNPAFLEVKRLQKLRKEQVWFYTLICKNVHAGFICIEQSKEEKTTYFIEKLAVLPQFRHKGIGRQLMDFALKTIKDKGGEKVSVALISHHLKLKEWYSNLGFKKTGEKEFTQLPFKVCFMAKELT